MDTGYPRLWVGTGSTPLGEELPSYWEFICMDATFWKWDPLTGGIVASGTTLLLLAFRDSH